MTDGDFEQDQVQAHKVELFLSNGNFSLQLLERIVLIVERVIEINPGKANKCDTFMQDESESFKKIRMISDNKKTFKN